MTLEFSLILLLLFCVISLTYLLYIRTKREKKQSLLLQNFSLHKLTDFMKHNSLDGSISTVARMFSDILKSTFKCEYIIFLRKKRGSLELNYYHGINAFNRADFKIEYSNELMAELKNDFFPRDISFIEKYMTKKSLNKIHHFHMDKFFPVFWRDNLYGFYVIKSNDAINSSSFRVVITQLVQSLAAAYHIKWHESKLEQLLQRHRTTSIATQVTDGDLHVERVLNLIKFKKTDAIIPQIIKSLQESSQVENLLFVYDTKENDSTTHLYVGNSPKDFQTPDCDELNTIDNLLSKSSTTSLDELSIKIGGDSSLIESLKQNNINRVASFPLSSSRKGFLAWKQNGSSEEFNNRINVFKKWTVDIFENIEEMELLEELSYTDNLTSLSNRRYFYKRLDEELNRAQRYERKLSLIIFDIDELKIINDTYGHQAGDEIIRQIGFMLKTSLRAIDVVARYGGDEFCIIMPETDQETCMKFVRRLHKKIVNTSFIVEQADKSISCTISMGISIYPDHASDSKKLLYAADMALLKAKESGRNQALISTNL